MQNDIQKLMNVIMHVGNSNPCSNNSMGRYAPAGTLLTEVEQEMSYHSQFIETTGFSLL